MKMEVKWFQDERGFGFIEYKENENILVHYSAIQDEQHDHKTLMHGEYVEFMFVKTANGYKVENVESLIKEGK